MSMSAALLCLSMAVYHESRGQPLIGQQAVAWVVLNRTRSSDYPADICSVVTQDAQFSFQWDHPRNTKAWELAVRIADDAMRGRSFDPTSGALHYARSDIRRPWMEGMVGMAIGDHIFWKES